MNISSLEQQQSQGLDTLQEAGKQATRQESTLRLGKPNQLEDFIKAEYNLQQVISLSLLD